ncbi:MAG: hypothetical protein E7663_06345 [Ruminococcaceae bacterium]|nr:hypothetical protein [Oscillospiraceae bacterium]
MLRIALRVRLRASPFAQDDNEGVGVGAFDDPFVDVLAAGSGMIKPVGVGALDDPFFGAFDDPFVGILDDPFVGALAAHPYIRHPLDDPH